MALHTTLPIYKAAYTLPDRIEPMMPSEAKALFIARFNDLLFEGYK